MPNATDAKEPHEAAETCPQCGRSGETLCVITVRLPLSLHGAVRAEAHRRQMSMNQFCVELLRAELAAEFRNDRKE